MRAQPTHSLTAAGDKFTALLTARDRARRNSIAGPSPEALTAAADAVMQELSHVLAQQVKAELPPEPPDNTAELEQVIDKINRLAGEISEQLDRAGGMDAARVADLIRELRETLDEQLNATNAATEPRPEKPPIPHVKARALAAAACAQFAPGAVTRFRLPLSDFAEAQRTYASGLIETAENAIRTRPARLDGRGFPL